MNVLIVPLLLAQAATAPAQPPAAPPTYVVPPVHDSISAREAAGMTDACEALAARSGWAVQIAILNGSGDMIRFTKMDGARRTSMTIARVKAESAFRTGRTTRDLGANPTAAAPFMGGLFTAAGGVPIVRAGQLAGAIGVSGGTADQDEQCALAAIKTLK